MVKEVLFSAKSSSRPWDLIDSISVFTTCSIQSEILSPSLAEVLYLVYGGLA